MSVYIYNIRIFIPRLYSAAATKRIDNITVIISVAVANVIAYGRGVFVRYISSI